MYGFVRTPGSPVLVLQQQLVKLLRLSAAVQVVSLLEDLLCPQTHTQHDGLRLYTVTRQYHALHIPPSAVIYLYPKRIPRLNSALCGKRDNLDRTVQGVPAGMQLFHSVHRRTSQKRIKCCIMLSLLT